MVAMVFAYANRMKEYIETTYHKKYNSHTNKYEDEYEYNMSNRVCQRNEERYDDTPCRFDPSTLGDCQNFPHSFEMTNGERNINPCVFLKLNKIWGWKPRPVDVDGPVFEVMTDQLREAIWTTKDKNQVWFDCRGRFAADREALNITYFPSSQGIPIDKYFPYEGGMYEPPLVAVKFNMNEQP